MRRIAVLFFLLIIPVVCLADTVDDLLASMSTRDKLGQCFMVWFRGPEVSPEISEMIEKYRIGGVILYSVSGNVENPGQLRRLTVGLQRLALDKGPGVGLIVAADQEGGPVTRLREGFTVFPASLEIAARGLDAAREQARVTARELKSVGVNMNLAPVVDVNVNPDNPVIGERAYGDDPALVARFGAAVIEAYNQAGLASCAKHFPGHGDTDMDSHVDMPLLPHSRRRLDTVELAPFRAAVEAGVPAIMTAHLAVPALTGSDHIPATMSRAALQDLLRGEMGFGGVVISDSLGMGALMKRSSVEVAAAGAFAAGCDILLFGADPDREPGEQKRAFEYVLDTLESGVIPMSRLDESARRVLELKKRFGMIAP
jgi:beta-N-acetylhexosaminidase